jgi:uncharacterized protein YndB with AHSA1/START domain
MTTPQRITLHRELPGTLEEVWALWTTKEGIESWWGPEGFRVEVRKLELRPQGELVYAMIATAPQTIAFMERAGMPTTTVTKIVYRELERPRRLGYLNVVDFVPGVAAYDVGTLVELEAGGKGVRLKLTLDPMHDADWTGRAVMGWESELGKLERLLSQRRG